MVSNRIVIPRDDNQLKFYQQKWYKFAPRDDITLGGVVKVLELLDLHIDEAMYNKLGPHLKRHFSERSE
uniref:Uncharacterized protein n=1 Tax=viral metagenome TaxID=1070528 RepID=A0A6M3X5S2_9ZZZZ